MTEPVGQVETTGSASEATPECSSCGEQTQRVVMGSGIAFSCQNQDCIQLLVYKSGIASGRSAED